MCFKESLVHWHSWHSCLDVARLHNIKWFKKRFQRSTRRAPWTCWRYPFEGWQLFRCNVAWCLRVSILSRYKTDYEGFFISNLRSALQAALNFLCFFVWIPRIWAFLLPLLLSAIFSCCESYVVAIETSFCGNNAVHGWLYSATKRLYTQFHQWNS